jgi:5-dehydro-4-deoxyglucarate dehydratase
MSLTPSELQQQLRGVIAFVPTPFRTDEALDLDSLAAHLDFMCRSHVQTIVVCGGVGEYFALDDAEFGEVVRTSAAVVGGRASLLAGVGASTRRACALAECAASAGVDGLMVNPVHFLRPSEEGWFAHYRALAQAAGLGLMVFSTAGVSYAPDSLERLAEIPEVIAFKDELGDLKLFGELVERLGDRLTWINGMAETWLAPYVSLSAQAVTSGMVNVVPDLSHAIWDAASTSCWRELQKLLGGGPRALARLRERRNGYPIMVIKEALNLLGRPGGGAGRLPLLPLAEADREDLRSILRLLKCE